MLERNDHTEAEMEAKSTDFYRVPETPSLQEQDISLC